MAKDNKQKENGKKPFWKSKTYWGLLIAAIGMVLSKYATSPWLSMIGHFLETFGLLLAGYGRAKAIKQVVFKNKSDGGEE